jgi:hypothetical protein
MSPIQGISRAVRAAAACAALACAGAVLAEPAAAPPATAPAASGMTHEHLRAVMQERHAEYVTQMLDHLGARLEIKASQEPAWQAFSASMRELLSAAPHAAAAAPQDAASLARDHAEHAAEHAQALARLADATAKLEQALGPDQRTVLDEAARRFARHGGEHGWMGHGEGHGDHEGSHCDAHHGHGAMPYGHPGHGDDDTPHRPLAH